MKNAFWTLGIVMGMGILLAWAWMPKTSRPSNSPTATIKVSRTNIPPVPPLTLVTPAQWLQVHSAEDAAWQAHPDLEAQYQQVVTTLEAQKAQFDEAMIKADPKVAPVILKLNQLREKNQALASASQTDPTKVTHGVNNFHSEGAPVSKMSPPSVGSPGTFTAVEWQELSMARSAAVTSNPDLMNENQKLMERKQLLEGQLDAAVVESNPSLAPTLAKMEAQKNYSEVARTAPASPTPTAK